jgi:N-acetylglucosamine-6-phosphate deacetylase
MLDGSALASSVAGLDHMVRVMAAATKAPLWDVIRMATLTPAERSGLADDVGSLEPEKRADVLVLSKRLQVRRVVLGGVEVSD